MPTVQQLLDDIDSRLPNAISQSRKITWMNDTQNEIWRYMASTEVYEITTIGGQALYTLASDVATDMIKNVQVSNSTVIDGTEGYGSYDYAGPNDELTGQQWYDALGQIGIYPAPTTDESGYNIKVTYEASPTQLSTGTLATVPDVNVEYQDILKWRVLRDIARSGSAPDVELANNYQADYDEILRRVRMDFYKRKLRNPQGPQWSYQRGWWNG